MCVCAVDGALITGFGNVVFRRTSLPGSRGSCDRTLPCEDGASRHRCEQMPFYSTGKRRALRLCERGYAVASHVCVRMLCCIGSKSMAVHQQRVRRLWVPWSLIAE